MPRTIGSSNEIPARGRSAGHREYAHTGTAGAARYRSRREWMCNGTGSVRVAQHNMGVIRHMVLNFLKYESTKISVRKKRIRAALNDTFQDKTSIGQ